MTEFKMVPDLHRLLSEWADDFEAMAKDTPRGAKRMVLATRAEECRVTLQSLAASPTPSPAGGASWAQFAKEQAARATAAEARVKALEEALDDAAEAIEHWGAYASSYLQEKHDWQGDIARARAARQDNG